MTSDGKPPSPPSRGPGAGPLVVLVAGVLVLTLAIFPLRGIDDRPPMSSVRVDRASIQAPDAQSSGKPIGVAPPKPSVMTPPIAPTGRVDVDQTPAAPSGPGLLGHGWIMVPAPRLGGTLLLHLPPRGLASGSVPQRGISLFGKSAADDMSTTGRGGVVAVARLGTSPFASAHWDHRLLILSERPAGQTGGWRVEEVNAYPESTGSGGLSTSDRSASGRRGQSIWGYPPGRPVERSPLRPVDGSGVVSFVGSGVGAVALMAPRGASPQRRDAPILWGQAELAWMLDAGWQHCGLPWSSDQAFEPGTADRVALLGFRDGFILLVQPDDVQAGKVMSVWTARPGNSTSEFVGPPACLNWTRSAWSMAMGDGVVMLPRPQVVAGQGEVHESGQDLDKANPTADLRLIPGSAPSDDVVLLAERDADSTKSARASKSGPPLRLVALGSAGPKLITSIDDASSAFPIAVTGLAGTRLASPVVVLAWSAPESEQDAESSNTVGLRVQEVSLATGTSLFAGPANVASSGLPERLRLVGAALGLLTLCVVIFVLRSEPEPKLSLPAGCAPAGPLRRILAGGFDLMLALWLGLLLMGRSDESITQLGGLASGRLDLGLWLLVLVLGALLASIGETFWGRSMGKFVTDCRVVSVSHARSSERQASGGQVPAELRPIEWWQAAIRNFVRWLIPGIGLLFIFDSDGRHPGDVAGRTLVVVDIGADSDESVEN